MTKPHGLQALEQPLSALPDTLRQLILERIQNLNPLRAGDWHHGQERCG